MNIKSKYFLNLVLPIFLLLAPVKSYASEVSKNEMTLPLWELGIGIGAIHQPYYTGTKQTRQIAFPTIVPTYRDKVFKSDDKGMRAQLFKSDRIKLDLSADLNLAIDSDDVDLRIGMDDIENIVQFGPSFEVLLKETSNSSLFLNVPVRGVFEVGSGVESSGVNISPNIFYQSDYTMLKNKWKFGATAGPQFGSSDYHNIYYGVDDRFATADRDAYKTNSGYSGSRLQLTLKTKNQKRFMLWFLRYENIDGANFDDSPLVETNSNLTVGFLYTHNFFKSKTLVNP